MPIETLVLAVQFQNQSDLLYISLLLWSFQRLLPPASEQVYYGELDPSANREFIENEIRQKGTDVARYDL